MNNFKNRLKSRTERFLAGRYGMDTLSRDIYIVSLILFVIGIIFNLGVLYIIAMAGFGFCAFRTYSRKISQRRLENQKYLNFIGKFTKKRRLLAKKWKDRKTHRYYTCKSCRQTIRVPKGKGKIEIKCPKCGNSFIKKT